MKNFNLKSKILFIYSLVFFASCSEFLDVNQNPNSPVSQNLPLNAKLPAALVAVANQEALQINQIGGFWGGYWGTNNDGSNLFFDLKTYNGLNIRTQREGIPVWETGYNNILYFRLIQTEAEQAGDSFYVGVSKIMQGWVYLRLVDFYNNVPFDQAVQGSTFLNPAYQQGQEVYAKAIDLISLGIEDVKASNIQTTMNHGDILFKGNKQHWAKFGNTVKLRALLRQSEKGDPAYISAQLNSIAVEGSGFLGLGEMAAVNPGYLNSTGKMNPFWENYYRNVQGVETANRQNIRPTEYVISTLTNLQDPRLQALYTATSNGYKGVLFGNPDVGNPIYDRQQTSAFKGPLENSGQPTGLFHSFGQPLILMSDFESLFLQAEASYRGWLGIPFAALYQQGIQASFTYLKVNAGLAEYLSSPDVILSDAQAPLEKIIQQKWLALNSISSIEAWNDYRRLGIPAFPASNASGVQGRPLRLMYPETEHGTNYEEVAKQGPDLVLVNKVWWMP
jgi:hypothetical protein